MQIVTGYLLDRQGIVEGIYPPEAFEEAFISCLLVEVGCLALCVGSRSLLKRGRPKTNSTQGG